MEATFSQRTKLSLSQTPLPLTCCKRSLLYGILLFSGIRRTDKSAAVGIAAEELAGKLTAELYGDTFEAIRPYILKNSEAVIGRLLEPYEKTDTCINTEIFECEECPRVFVRGAFLACGTVSSPESRSHLEFRIGDLMLAAELSEVLMTEGIEAKTAIRNTKGKFGLYFKSSTALEDLLYLMGAQKEAFEYVNGKIYNELRNDANRFANCVVANTDRTVNTAQSQIDAILSLLETDSVGRLPPQLRETLDLRAANPEASLSELALLHNPPITKSGVNHRLKKLISLANSKK